MAKTNSTDTHTKHNNEVNDASVKMYYLQEIVKLAALATESTRVLTSMKEALVHMPEAKERPSKQVRAMYSWEDRPDSTGEVLSYVADELESLNEQFTELAYRYSKTA